ncbi:hypothetical protein GBA52_022392 [Prunus armeniaca]|nr:hypothetical protein GBA52_022392 [Prunus armeniaca]
MGERPGGSIRDHGQDPPPPVLHPVTKVFDKNDDEDLWIQIVRITNLKEEEEKKKKKQRASLRVCFTTGTSGKERQREAPDQKKAPQVY